jgi:hypothetical protein
VWFVDKLWVKVAFFIEIIELVKWCECPDPQGLGVTHWGSDFIQNIYGKLILSVGRVGTPGTGLGYHSLSDPDGIVGFSRTCRVVNGHWVSLSSNFKGLGLKKSWHPGTECVLWVIRP